MYYKENFENNFPWIRNLDEREKLLNSEYKNLLNLKDYVQTAFNDSVAQTPLSGDENDDEKRHKQLIYLNMKWFMQNLLDRKDRTTMGAGLEARVPFADHRIIEYLYNVPFEYKFYNNMEKGLLREAVKDFVPNEIVMRKKNPYPKTHNPAYLNSVKQLLSNSLKNKNSVLYELFDIKVINDLLGENNIMQKPWYGQLMGQPQLIAYLYQIDVWFENYNLNIVKN